MKVPTIVFIKRYNSNRCRAIAAGSCIVEFGKRFFRLHHIDALLLKIFCGGGQPSCLQNGMKL